MRDSYDDALSLEEARRQYFAANGFGADGGYDATWVDVKIGPFPTRMLNTAGRKRAVPFHDLHHVITGYRTNFRGECEIGAWEVATGCGDHWAAWMLNLGVFGAGLLFAAGDLWRAFLRGRQSRNLYRSVLTQRVLATSVREIRRDLGIGETPAPARLGSGRLRRLVIRGVAGDRFPDGLRPRPAPRHCLGLAPGAPSLTAPPRP